MKKMLFVKLFLFCWFIFAYAEPIEMGGCCKVPVIGPTGPMGPTGSTGPTGATGTISEIFAHFNSDTNILAGSGSNTPITFPSQVVNVGGITRTGNTTFNMNTTGYYQINWTAQVSNAGGADNTVNIALVDTTTATTISQVSLLIHADDMTVMSDSVIANIPATDNIQLQVSHQQSVILVGNINFVFLGP